MNIKQTYLVVRFYGRFVFVEWVDSHGQLTGDLTVLAVNMIKNPDVDAAKDHDVLLTMVDRAADLKPRLGETMFPPNYRTFGTELVPFEGSRDIWDLRGCEVEFPMKGKFQWTNPVGIPVADLGRLIDQKKPELQPLDFAAKAVIKLHAGFGSAFHLTTEDVGYRFVPYGSSTGRTSEALPDDKEERLADGVQVVMLLPDREFAITVKKDGTEHRLNVAAPPPGVDAELQLPENVPSLGASLVVVSFSNLCTNQTQEGVDREFAAFYEVLVDPPLPVRDRLVPVGRGRKSVIQPLIPFGDCFLAARVSVRE